MRIGYDGRILANSRKTGIGLYAHELLKALSARESADRYRIYYPRGGSPCCFRSARVSSAVSLVPGEIREDRFFALWYGVYLPLRIKFDDIDVFHGTSFLLPRTGRAKSVVTIFDLTHERYPDLALGCSAEFAARAKISALEADAVIAISECTRRDVIEIYGVREEKVRVIHLGVDARFRPPSRGENISAFRSRYGLPDHYVLSVISLHPRKNLPRLLEAFSLMKERASLPHSLVVAGKDYGSPELRALVEASGVGESFRFLEYFPESDLPLLYAAAEAFVFPSLYEGFGLPPVEAMACGTPVASSRAGSLPEVLGEAALYFDPREPEEIAASLEELLTQPETAGRLRCLGMERARRYRWDECARRTRELYREILGA